MHEIETPLLLCVNTKTQRVNVLKSTPLHLHHGLHYVCMCLYTSVCVDASVVRVIILCDSGWGGVLFPCN